MPSRKLRLRWVELGAVLLLVVIAVVLVLPVVRNTLAGSAPRLCVDNLKQWGAIFKIYSTENDWRWPLSHGFEPYGSASNAAGCTNVEDAYDFSPDLSLLFPEYGSDPLLLVCPDAGQTVAATKLGPLVIRAPRLNPGVLGIAEGSCEAAGSITNGDASYTYLGWRIDPFDDTHPVVTREQALAAGLPASGPAAVVTLLSFLQPSAGRSYQDVQAQRGDTIRASIQLGALGRKYYEGVGNDGTGLFTPLWHGVSILYLGDDEPPDYPFVPVTPVMWDAIFQDENGNPSFTHRDPNGVNVLYLDGHVEFKTYPGVFPVAPSFATMKRVP